MDLDEAIRVRLSVQPSTAPNILHSLASDPSVTVRAALALNPAVPPATDAALARDPDERVRELIARKLSALAPSLSAGALTQLQQEILETLTTLAEDEAVRVRAAIAEAVKHLPEAPRALILRLAHDRAVTVYEPIILFSPLLTGDDLMSLVAAAPSAGTRLAVARRAALPPEVSDALVSIGTGDVILALLSNGSAQIREATLDALIRRAAPHPDWHEPLVHRPVLSAQGVRSLAGIVADHLLAVLAARGDLDPLLAAELRTRLSPERPSGEQEPCASAEKPVEADLLDAAREGDAGRAAVMLALAADVPLPVVRRAASLRSAKGLVSLTWKAGFSMKAGYALQVLLAHLSPAAALKAGPGNSFPLSVQEMHWQLEFLSSTGR
jgi:hypothetical protein